MYTLKYCNVLIKAKACFSIVLYFRGASLSALLKNSMGCSCPFIFFCNRITATVCSDAKENMKKSLVKSGLIRTGFWVSAYFTSSKDCFSSMVHLTPISLFSMFVMFLRSFSRFGMNLLKKFIFPMKDCSSLIFLGWLICNIHSILFGSILVPSSNMIWPRSFPSWRPNTVFLGFKDRPYFLHFSRTFLR